MIILEIRLQLSDALTILNRYMSPVFPAFSEPSAALWMTSLALLTVAAAVSLFWALGVIRWAAQKGRHSGGLPHISVIVAGRNEEQHIGVCLAALVNLDYDLDKLDVIFVDDHSTDGTRAVAENVAAGCNGILTVLDAPICPAGMGPKKNAIAHGVAHARGEILLLTDADCLVKPGWARSVMSCYSSATGAVTGPVFPPYEPGFVNLLSRLERIFISYTSASAIGWGHPASASGGNFSYRREAFDQLGGIAFSEVASGDDDLMAQAIASRGWKVDYARGADAVVEHLRQPSLRQQINATIRHQSTTRYYPLGWRLVYFVSILSSVGVVAAIIAPLFVKELLPLLAAALGSRLLAEGVAVRTFCRQCQVRLSLIGFLVAEVCLPAYLLTRAGLSLFPSYSWQARTHHRTASAADVL